MTLEYEIHDQAAIITMNRPKVGNAFDEESIKNLTAALKRAEADPYARTLLLKGAGKHFCAGADLNWMMRMASFSEAENEADALLLAELMQTLFSLTIPTLAYVHGAAFGGGAGLAACCDIVIADETARFCFSETKLGLIPAVISPYVVNAIGERRAKRYFLTAEAMSAEQAYFIGLVHELVYQNDVDVCIDNIMRSLYQNGPEALAASKALMTKIQNEKIGDKLNKVTAKEIASIRASDEGKEGMRAFLEKRPANWIQPE